MQHEREAPTSAGLLHLTVMELLMVPYLGHSDWAGPHTHLAGLALFPLDPPAWSLFFELVANFAFFAYFKRFKAIHFAPLIAVVLALHWLRYRSGITHPGWSSYTFHWGFPRVIAEFGMGVLLYTVRLRQPGALPHLAWVITPIVIWLFTVDNDNLDLFNAMFMAPLAIWLCAGLRPGPLGRRLCKALGELSYPLYIVHMPVYLLAVHVCHVNQFSLLVQLLATSIASVAAARILAVVDLRIRRKLLRQWG
jgi:peptidoglycan/LPS O-acetylase OafA/YrhL